MKSNASGICRSLAVFLLAAGLAACGVDSQEPPSLIGPSGFAQTVSLSASPDRLARDGSSQSVVTVFVRNDAAQPVAGQRVTLSSNGGTLSQTEVTTGSDGRATVIVTAPPAGTPGNTLDIFATPVGANFEDVTTRSLSIALMGVSNAGAPVPSFVVSPVAPVLRENTVFDASGTTDENAACLDRCTYVWDFGAEGTRTGRIVTHQFQTAQTTTVRLTVTDPAGTSASTTQNVAVAQGAAPTATFAFSPASPGQFEPVTFTAEGSRAGVAGRTITSYQWNFGDGATATGVTTSHAYNVLGTYVVTLTVTDSAGVRTTTSQNVTVAAGVTAAFNTSPTNPDTSDSVIFDAEPSRGSSAGFGGRNPIVEYIWDFGDHNAPGLVSTSNRIIQYRYSEGPKTYTINLTVVDSAGRRATTSQTLSVSAPAAP
jgi:PKD repeat protein